MVEPSTFFKEGKPFLDESFYSPLKSPEMPDYATL